MGRPLKQYGWLTFNIAFAKFNSTEMNFILLSNFYSYSSNYASLQRKQA